MMLSLHNKAFSVGNFAPLRSSKFRLLRKLCNQIKKYGDMAKLREKLINELEKMNGLKDQASPVSGGSALFLNNQEFAHFHNDNELDLKLTKRVIAREGLSHPKGSLHHPKRSAGSQWIELRFNKPSDLKNVIKMVKLAVDQL